MFLSQFFTWFIYGTSVFQPPKGCCQLSRLSGCQHLRACTLILYMLKEAPYLHNTSLEYQPGRKRSKYEISSWSGISIHVSVSCHSYTLLTHFYAYHQLLIWQSGRRTLVTTLLFLHYINDVYMYHTHCYLQLTGILSISCQSIGSNQYYRCGDLIFGFDNSHVEYSGRSLLYMHMELLTS